MINASNGSATTQGGLWGSRAQDWASFQEGTGRPVYERVLEKIPLDRTTRVLDVGCGSGIFMALAAARGAQMSGLDAAAPLVALASERIPAADVRTGEMEALPFDDGTFDLVTGFNSFQYAANPTAALAEARRVARSDARLVVGTWGKATDCDATGYLAAMGRLLPPPPPGPSGPFTLSAEGALESFVEVAGWSPEMAEEVPCPFEYPDLSTALRGILSSGQGVRAIGIAGEQATRATVAAAIEPFRSNSGSYRLENKFRYLIASRDR